MSEPIIDWLRRVCGDYEVEPIAVYRAAGEHEWPLIAQNEAELRRKLSGGGHFLPLPKEPAALANVLEVSVVDFVLRYLKEVVGGLAQRGTERGYPDIEVSGEAFGGGHHAVDVKVARRAISKSKTGSGKAPTQTDSRITLYTGNTYFRHPEMQWSGTFRPFQDYESHVDIIVLYTLNTKTDARVEDVEVIVQEPWRIASRQRSSTTREYIGAVMSIADLRAGHGEFSSPEEFYRFWRKYQFKVGRVVQQQLDKRLKQETQARSKAKLVDGS